MSTDPRLDQVANITIKLLEHYNALSQELADRCDEEELAELRAVVEQTNDGVRAALSNLGISVPATNTPD